MKKILKNIFSSKEKKQFLVNNKPQGVKAYFQDIGRPMWSDRSYERFAEEAYMRNVIANRCISIIANGASSVPFVLYKKSKSKRVIVKNHDLLDLLKKPNPVQDKFTFFENLYSFKLISGNSYIQAVFLNNERHFKNPKELYVLRPDRVTIIAGNKKIPVGYKYKVNSRETVFHVNSITGESEILHLKNFHPTNDWYGLSPIESAAYSIDQHNEAGKWNQAMLQNGARPSGALIVRPENNNGFLNEGQFDRLKEQLFREYTGVMNSGKPLLLEGGLEWKEMSLNPRDMDFLNIKHSSARDIALAFGVPSQLLGIPGDNTYNNMAEARLFLWEQTIIPFIENVVNALNGWLVPMFDELLELDYDKDSIHSLALRRESKWNRIKDSEFLDDGEKREMLGLNKGGK